MAALNPLSWFDPKKRAIKRYFRTLPRRLLQDYGHTGPYTPDQVRSTIARYRIGPSKYAPYAQAIFCDETALTEIPGQMFSSIRRELGTDYFGSEAGFSYGDVRSYVAESAEANWASGHGHHGGGDHGGGDHGGGHH